MTPHLRQSLYCRLELALRFSPAGRDKHLTWLVASNRCLIDILWRMLKKSQNSSSLRKLRSSSTRVSDAKNGFSESEDDSFSLPVPPLGDNLTPEQWLIQKLTRHIQNGNVEETRKSLSDLSEVDLKSDDSQAAVFACRLLDTLVNILDSNDLPSKTIALDILESLCVVDLYHQYLSKINIGTALCENFVGDYQSRKMVVKAVNLFCLFGDKKSIQIEVLEANVTVKLLNYIKLDRLILQHVTDEIFGGDRFDRVVLATVACSALRLMSPNKTFRRCFIDCGGATVVLKLYTAKSTQLLIASAILVEELSKYGDVISQFDLNLLIRSLLELLRRGSPELQVRIAACLSSITDYRPAVDVFIRCKGVDFLVYFLKRRDANKSPELVSTITSALSNCAAKPNTAKKLREMEIIDVLTPYITGEDEKLLTPCCVLLAEIATGKESVALLRYTEVLQPIIGFLITATNSRLIVASATIVANSIEDNANIEILEEQGAAKFLWFLLNHEEPDVIAAAARAIAKISPVSKCVSESSHCLAGGLERLVALLDHSQHVVVLEATIAISRLGRDAAALKVLIDHNVVQKLARLTKTKNPKLQHAVAEAVSVCCSSPGAPEVYGKQGGVRRLVTYLWAKQSRVQRECILALAQLSVVEKNCLEMTKCGAVAVLLLMTSSPDEEERKAAATSIANIRRLTNLWSSSK